MAEAHRTYGIAAWKVYTQWGPKRVGWWLDDPRVGVPFIEQARRLGVKTICIHKGLSFDGYEPRYAACDDVGRVARMYPDVTFIIYHSGIEARRPEGAYDPRERRPRRRQPGQVAAGQRHRRPTRTSTRSSARPGGW